MLRSSKACFSVRRVDAFAAGPLPRAPPTMTNHGPARSGPVREPARTCGGLKSARLQELRSLTLPARLFRQPVKSTTLARLLRTWRKPLLLAGRRCGVRSGAEPSLALLAEGRWVMPGAENSDGQVELARQPSAGRRDALVSGHLRPDRHGSFFPPSQADGVLPAIGCRLEIDTATGSWTLSRPRTPGRHPTSTRKKSAGTMQSPDRNPRPRRPPGPGTGPLPAAARSAASPLALTACARHVAWRLPWVEICLWPSLGEGPPADAILSAGHHPAGLHPH